MYLLNHSKSRVVGNCESNTTAIVKSPKITLLNPLPVFNVCDLLTVSLFAKNGWSPVSLIGVALSNSSLQICKVMNLHLSCAHHRQHFLLQQMNFRFNSSFGKQSHQLDETPALTSVVSIKPFDTASLLSTASASLLFGDR